MATTSSTMQARAVEAVGNRRSACDRCRRHKLRCEQGSTSHCRRCEKANAICTTGPSLRSGRPPQQPKGPQRTSIDTQSPARTEAFPSSMDILHPGPLDTNPEMVTSKYYAGSQFPRTISLSNMDDFDDFWSENFDHRMHQGYADQYTSATLPTEPWNDPLKKLADLHTALLADLELVKGSKTADKCASTIPGAENFMIGRLFVSSTILITVLNYFQTPTTGTESSRLECDTPTLCALISTYVSLTRIYRTIFSSILDSLPFLMGHQGQVPQLFPGMNLGGFTLEARLDLQIQILLQTTENMIGDIEQRFGLSTKPDDSPEGLDSEGGTAARMLRMMLADEANEQPPLHEPRGECKPLKEIIALLKNATRAPQA